mgnify:FL=1
MDEMNIQLLYISIDENMSYQKWSEYVQSKKLFGTHYLATASFIANIQEKLYNGKDITIPRYLLINREGKIIEQDLPRPSEMEALKKSILGAAKTYK